MVVGRLGCFCLSVDAAHVQLKVNWKSSDAVTHQSASGALCNGDAINAALVIGVG
jgi:hypothetical protein